MLAVLLALIRYGNILAGIGLGIVRLSQRPALRLRAPATLAALGLASRSLGEG